MSMCRLVSCVVGNECWLWLVCSLDKTLLAFTLLRFVLQGQTCMLLQGSLDFLLLYSNPLSWKGYLFFFWVLVLEGFAMFIDLVNFSFFSISAWGLDLDYCAGEWFALETNWDHSVFLRLYPSTAFQTFVDFEGYPFSSKEFLPTVVGLMVIWIKFTILVHFSSLIPKMFMFTLVISCLTMSNVPWLMD